MIRSAQHLEWDAYMATGPARAELQRQLVAAERLVRACVRAAALSFEQACHGMRALNEALRAAGAFPSPDHAPLERL